jgi:hypothetical protein
VHARGSSAIRQSARIGALAVRLRTGRPNNRSSPVLKARCPAADAVDVRVATTVMLLCLAAVGVLIAAPPHHRAAPRPAVRVVVEHRTVEKRLPRRTQVKRLYVDASAPAPASPPASAPAPVAYSPAAPVRVVRVSHPTALAQAPARKPQPTAATGLPTDAASLHRWEEVHHRDAPNHDQLEHVGSSGG